MSTLEITDNAILARLFLLRQHRKTLAQMRAFFGRAGDQLSDSSIVERLEKEVLEHLELIR